MGILSLYDNLLKGDTINMRISNISANSQYSLPIKKVNKNNQTATTPSNVTFAGNKEKAIALGLALASTLPLASCQAENMKDQPTTVDTQQDQQTTVDDAQAVLDAAQANSEKTQLADIGFVQMPITEFYFTNSEGTVEVHPNEDIPTNENGSIIVTVTQDKSEEKDEGATLGEIIQKIYSDDLDEFSGAARRSLYNKIIDETIQANPSLAAFVHAELGDDIDNYDDIANLNLYYGKSSQDETLDTRLLTMPTVITYQVQGEHPDDQDFCYSVHKYSPNTPFASVIKDSDSLLDGEFASFEDMVYGTYGDDISDEAYRDIVYAIVNSPANAAEFEYMLDKMNFNDIIQTGNIHDINRAIDENTDNTMFGITLPDVATLRTQSHSADMSSTDKNGIIYQISPLILSVDLKDNTTGKLNTGDVFSAIDLLQFYASPDGHGKFANIRNGKTVLNQGIEYYDEFAKNILQQIVYANLDVFTTKYEDKNGVHNYGVFDVDPEYDTEGKSLEDIIKHSTINMNRLMDYSFVDENGVSRFEDGAEIKLPQFNYRINQCKTLKPCDCDCDCKPTTPGCDCPDDSNPDDPGCDCPDDPTQPTKPSEPTQPTKPSEPTQPTKPSEPTQPTKPTEPTQPTKPTEPTQPTKPTEPTQPTKPTEPTQPTKPTEPTQPTKPTEPTQPTKPTEPTVPTDTEPTVPTDTEPTVPTDTEPTVPTDTEPTVPTDTEPTVPTDTEPTVPTDTEPTTPTDTEPGTDIPPIDPSDTEPTTPTDTEPTVPTDTEPTVPTDTEPTVPTDTEPDVPSDTEPGTDIPPIDPSDTEPSTPTDTQPTTPSESEPDVPTDTEPTVPTDTEPTVPTDTEPDVPTDSESCPDDSTGDTVIVEPEPELPGPGIDDDGSDQPSVDEPPTDSEPDTQPETPSDSEPDTPSESQPAEPSESCPDDSTGDTVIVEPEPELPGFEDDADAASISTLGIQNNAIASENTTEDQTAESGLGDTVIKEEEPELPGFEDEADAASVNTQNTKAKSQTLESKLSSYILKKLGGAKKNA